MINFNILVFVLFRFNFIVSLSNNFYNKYILSLLYFYVPNESKEEPEIVKAKFSYFDECLKIEDEIKRLIKLFIVKLNLDDIEDDLREEINCEMNKANLLLNGKLKMFNNLCLISLKEMDLIEDNKHVNISDLEGYYNLLEIELIKIRRSSELIINRNDMTKDDEEKENQVVVKKKRPAKVVNKIQASNISERNRRYIERMKKLKEKSHNTITLQAHS